MNKITLNQVKRNWKNSLGTFLVIFISTFFVSSFLNLAISSQSSFNLIKDGKIANFFIIFFAITFLISIIMIKIVMNMSFELKMDQYINLRILGLSITKVRILVFLEYLLFLLPLIILAIVLSRFGSLLIIDVMKKQDLLSSKFILNNKPLALVLYSIFSVLFVMILLMISTVKVNTINSKGNQELSTKKLVFKYILGMVIFICGGLIYFAHQQFDAVSYLFGGIFLIVGLMICNKPIIYLVTQFIKLIFRKSYLVTNSLKELNFNIKKIINVISMFTFIIFFVIYTTKFLNLSAQEGDLKLYANAFSFLADVISFMLTIYFVIIAINLIYLFIIENCQTYNVLTINGYTENKIVLHILIQNLIVTIITSIFVYIPTIFVGLIFKTSMFNGLEWIWVLIPFAIMTIVTIISLLSYKISFRKKHF